MQHKQQCQHVQLNTISLGRGVRRARAVHRTLSTFSMVRFGNTYAASLPNEPEEGVEGVDAPPIRQMSRGVRADTLCGCGPARRACAGSHVDPMSELTQVVATSTSVVSSTQEEGGPPEFQGEGTHRLSPAGIIFGRGKISLHRLAAGYQILRSIQCHEQKSKWAQTTSGREKARRVENCGNRPTTR
jgi:hypothetical protein